ncbi:hypothetical protein [Baaleninema sp.]|uniref:hypothetical protein n=1 Tax=Baaleninema sp. TaxID=3101197 RepID=UPI003D03D847
MAIANALKTCINRLRSNLKPPPHSIDNSMITIDPRQTLEIQQSRQKTLRFFIPSPGSTVARNPVFPQSTRSGETPSPTSIALPGDRAPAIELH